MSPSVISANGSFNRPRFDLCGSVDLLRSQEIRCLPDLIRHNAEHNPSHSFCFQSQQEPGDSSFKFKEITFYELDQAVGKCCDWIIANVPKAKPASLGVDGRVEKSQPIAILMESDVGLFIYVAALLSLNVPCLLLSMRLTPAAIRNLLEQTKASSIIVSARSSNIEFESLDEAKNEPGKASLVHAIPSTKFLGSEPLPPQSRAWTAYAREFVREDDRSAFILHSSGTTGLPKAIPLAQRNLLGYANCHEFPGNQDESAHGINLSTLPLFHGFGFLGPCLALSVGKPVCFPPSSTIVNGSLVVSLVRQASITSLMTVPTIMEDITSLEDFLTAAQILGTLDFVAVGGGGLKSHIAHKLHNHGVKILNHFGATELGALAPIFRPTEDYDYTYLRVRSDLGLRLDHLDSAVHGEYACKLFGYPFGWEKEFELQDRLQYNPLRSDSEVKILGRNDDLIVLGTGEKVQPHHLEQTLEQNPLIRRAVMFGQGQAEVGVLIEPALKESENQVAVLDAIWPIVQQANFQLDGHAQISTKEAILLKPRDKMIPLSDKGVPQRKEVYSVFDAEIKLVYEQLENSTAASSAMIFDVTHATESIRAMVQKCLPSHSKDWKDTDDFVHLGMDSLQATRLRRILNSSLKRAEHATFGQHDLPIDFVYSHPSVSQLVGALSDSALAISSAEAMTHLAEQFSIRPSADLSRPNGSTILLTGSTGNLGSYILDSLVRRANIREVICLVRSEDGTPDASVDRLKSRQERCLKERGIELPEQVWDKVAFVAWQPGAPQLGLNSATYDRLKLSVTDIFHGAWPMDFKRKLQSFVPQIQAVKDLVQLGQHVHESQGLRPRIILASSIAVVGRYRSQSKRAIVPEQTLREPHSTLPMGYAEAKWVCEKVLESAFDHARDEIKPMIVRIGQLSGSRSTGYWSSQEHMAVLVKASQQLKKLPDLKGSLSWIPVDRAASTVADMLLRPSPEHLVVHLENPVRQSWPTMCTIIARQLNLQPERLPYEKWLEQAAVQGSDLENLLPFFKDHFLTMSGGELVLDTKAARDISPTLKSTGGVGMETVALYLESWKRQGLLE